MRQTRRRTLGMGAQALVGLAIAPLVGDKAHAQDAMRGDAYATDGGEIVVHPVSHASFVMTTPGPVIYSDPVGGAGAYDGLPAPDLVLITHEHGDHYDPETLAALVGDDVRLVVNPAVHAMLADDLKARATVLGNGESVTVEGVDIEAIPAYNTTEDRLQYHPEGRDNGYVLGIDGLRVYIAGDTEDIPEMRELENIDIAFVPMNLPYTMDVEQAASAVADFAPRHVYPYHYGDSDIDAFASRLAEADAPVEVVRGGWYA